MRALEFITAVGAARHLLIAAYLITLMTFQVPSASALADSAASSPLEVSSKFDPREQTFTIQLKNISSSVVRIDGLSLRRPTVLLSTMRPNSWNAVRDFHLLSDNHIKRSTNNVGLSAGSTSILALEPSEIFTIDYDLSEVIREHSKKLPEESKRRTTSLYFELSDLTKNLKPIEGLKEQKIDDPVRIELEFIIDELEAKSP
ncbi:MAG: hypothetical protein IAE97_10765 [Chthoniobacterales bacterium]|nr:hypothetical protein [Chthoniobacterales bacterium]